MLGGAEKEDGMKWLKDIGLIIAIAFVVSIAYQLVKFELLVVGFIGVWFWKWFREED